MAHELRVKCNRLLCRTGVEGVEWRGLQEKLGHVNVTGIPDNELSNSERVAELRGYIHLVAPERVRSVKVVTTHDTSRVVRVTFVGGHLSRSERQNLQEHLIYLLEVLKQPTQLSQPLLLRFSSGFHDCFVEWLGRRSLRPLSDVSQAVL